MSDSPLQTRFDGGVISKRLSGRFDSEIYKKALGQCDDFEPLAQGSLRMRAGTVKEIKSTGDTRIRLLRMRVSNGDDFMLELLDSSMNIYFLNGTNAGINSQGAPTQGESELVLNGDFSGSDGNSWQAAKFGAGVGGGVFFTSQIPDPNTGKPDQLGWAEVDNGNNPSFALLYQKITLQADSDVQISFSCMMTAAGATASTMQIKVSSTDPVTWADQTKGGEILSVAKDTAIDGMNSLPPRPELPNNGFTTFDLAPIHILAGQYWISFQGVQANKSLLIDNVDAVASFTLSGGSAPTQVATPWSANEVAALQFDTDSGVDRTVFTHGAHSPWFLKYGGLPGAWSFGNVNFALNGGVLPLGWGDAGSANVPAGWSWQGVTTKLAAANWPASISFAEGRAIYGGEPAQKNRIVASAANTPDIAAPPADGTAPGGPLDFKIATKGAIKWLNGLRSILGGTDQSGFEVTGSKGIPLAGDIQVPQQSGYQCASIQPVVADTKLLFVTSDFRRIKASSFEFQTQGWESKDILFAAEHLTLGLIKEIHQAYTPDGLVVAVQQDGTVIACTFDSQEQVEAWWTINVGAPVCSACLAQGTIGAYLWMAVNRNGGIYLERLPLSESGEETLNYIDSNIVLPVTAVVTSDGRPGNMVTGLDHLIGLQVRAIDQTTGGEYFGDFIVSAGPGRTKTGNANVISPNFVPQSNVGQIVWAIEDASSIDRSGHEVAFGLAYKATAATLPKNIKGGKASSAKLGMILNNSRQPKIGVLKMGSPNGGLKRAPDRTPATPAGQIEPLFTGKKTVGSVGWDDSNVITIQQDQPFRTEVCGLYSVTETNESAG